jgi:hypothetical protein
VSAAFERLRTAERLEGFPTGGVGQTLENYAAFVEARRAGAGARAEVEALLADGTPAGRLYAALLLRELDEEAGRRALEGLRADGSLLEAMWDCTPEPFTVGQLADDALRGRALVETEPPLRGSSR